MTNSLELSSWKPLKLSSFLHSLSFYLLGSFVYSTTSYSYPFMENGIPNPNGNLSTSFP